MSNYRRPKIEGARVFFTVALAQRGSSFLVDEIVRLREAVRVTKAERPFEIDAFVVCQSQSKMGPCRGVKMGHFG